MSTLRRQKVIKQIKNVLLPTIMEQMDEGGLGGHMSHVHEDYNLTFGEIKAIFHQASKGKLENVSEKLDGQNVFFTFAPVEGLRFARNTGHIKTNGMGADEIETRWADKPRVAAVFGKAYKVLSAAIASLSPADRAAIFNDGKIWYSAEIVGTLNPNVINYDQDAVVFHESGTVYDENGQPLNIDTSKNFAKLVATTNRMQAAIKDSGWKVLGPVMVSLQKLSNNEPLEMAIAGLNGVMNSYSMTNDNTLGEMFEEYLISEHMKDIIADDDTKSYLAELVSDFEKNLTSKKPILEDLVKEGLVQKEQVKAITDLIRNGTVLYAEATDTVRFIIKNFAEDILKGVASYLIINPDKEVQRLRSEVEKSIETIRTAGTEKSNEVMKKELSRLGNVDNVTSSMEGIVFKYGGKVYKLTGAFAPVNQLLGIAKYGR